MNQRIPLRLLLHVSAIGFAQFALGGVLIAALCLAISLFQSDARAEYTRAMSIVPLVAFSALGLLRALAIIVTAFVVRHRDST